MDELTPARTKDGGVGGHVIVYGLGNVVVAGLNFWLFAVYARVLQPEDYGAMSVIGTVCTAVSMVGLLGMNNAVQRFFFEEREEPARRRVWSSGFVGSVGLTAALALVTGLVMTGTKVFSALAGPAAGLALAALVPQAVVIWLQDRARLEFLPWRYAVLAMIQGIAGGVAGLFFVVYCGWGLRGFFAGSLFGAVVASGWALVTARALRPVIFSRSEFARLVRFGAPFVPAGVFIWLSSSVLRWLIVDFKGLAEAGLFEVAWKLAAPVWMFNAAVGQAFGPYAFRLQAEQPEYRARLVEAFHLIGAVTLLAGCTVTLFAREVCAVMAPAAYAQAAIPCGILALGFYFSATQQVTALGIAFAQRPRLIAAGWAGAAGLSYLLAIWLVPRFGAAGAAWSMVVVYGGLSLYYVICSQRLHPLPFRLGPVLLQIGLGLATVGIAWVMEPRPLTLAGIGLKFFWLVLATGGLIGWGGVDVRQVRRLVLQLPVWRVVPGFRMP